MTYGLAAHDVNDVRLVGPYGTCDAEVYDLPSLDLDVYVAFDCAIGAVSEVVASDAAGERIGQTWVMVSGEANAPDRRSHQPRRCRA